MGVDAQVLRLLIESRNRSVSFQSTMMIGRQEYWQLRASDLAAALSITADTAKSLLSHKYIEPLLQTLGADRIESLDNSEFEQATVIHDLNVPIPKRLKSGFSCVFDGGALEHIFNFPQAVKNCMEMVAVGGHFVGVTAANNFTGHGFYQFSPELYFRVFSAQNGFSTEAIFLCETHRGAPWYSVTDPETLGRRVELVNSRPTFIMTIARRVTEVEIFQTFPQQSDYSSAWSVPKCGSPAPPQLSRGVRALIPTSVKQPVRDLINSWKRAKSARAAARNRTFQSAGYRRL